MRRDAVGIIKEALPFMEDFCSLEIESHPVRESEMKAGRSLIVTRKYLGFLL